ncbi:MAG: peroxiredoxin [Gammaproteobacteria bacterium RIFCSPLOWO2_02_FULL_61_13]|nr:MAG: peroxiredoxin [Gammaproteobacteria bacterium RIFCSPLOWO2_02_FULL_61_13]
MSANPIRTLGVLLMSLFSSSAFAELQVGDSAPAFDLIDQYQKPQRLADYAGKWVVLYFYPKDDTPGCTTEACSFRDDIFKIRALGAEVLGISLDSAESHAEFAKKHGLPFPLLADTDARVTDSYGALMGLGPVKYAKRHTFIIGPDGKLAKIYRDVDPKVHSAEVIAELGRLAGKS